MDHVPRSGWGEGVDIGHSKWLERKSFRRSNKLMVFWNGELEPNELSFHCFPRELLQPPELLSSWVYPFPPSLVFLNYNWNDLVKYESKCLTPPCNILQWISFPCKTKPVIIRASQLGPTQFSLLLQPNLLLPFILPFKSTNSGILVLEHSSPEFHFTLLISSASDSLVHKAYSLPSSGSLFKCQCSNLVSPTCVYSSSLASISL